MRGCGRRFAWRKSGCRVGVAGCASPPASREAAWQLRLAAHLRSTAGSPVSDVICRGALPLRFPVRIYEHAPISSRLPRAWPSPHLLPALRCAVAAGSARRCASSWGWARTRIGWKPKTQVTRCLPACESCAARSAAPLREAGGADCMPRCSAGRLRAAEGVQGQGGRRARCALFCPPWPLPAESPSNTSSWQHRARVSCGPVAPY